MKRVNVVVVYATSMMFLMSGFLVGQAKTGSEKPAANGWMLTPTPHSEWNKDIPASIRTERDRYWETLFADEMPPVTGKKVGTAASEGVWDSLGPEIPELENRAVFTASFKTFHSVLSSSERAVYTEVSLEVDSVFDDRTRAGHPVPGGVITLLLPGGTVLLRSGETYTYLTGPRQRFLQPGRKYLLVLSYHPTGDFYLLGDDWDISDGTVRANTLRTELLSKQPKPSLNGLSVDQLSSAISQRVNNQN